MTASSAPSSATWRDYYELGKPRVVMLIVFTAIVGMFLAILELIKSRRIQAEQPTRFGDIWVTLAPESDPVLDAE